MDLEKDGRDCLDFWAYPSPLALIIVAKNVPGTASALAEEGLRVERRHHLHGAVLSLFIGGSTGPLAVKRRALKSLLLLILDTTAPPLLPPMTMSSCPYLGGGEGEV